MESIDHWLFIAVSTGFFLAIVWMMLNAAESRRWPTVPGVIIDSTLVETPAKSLLGSNLESRIRYRYSVEGVEHVGTVARFGEAWFTAKPLVRKYPAGKPVMVHYDPENPASSVLEPGITGIAIAILLLGVAFLAFSLYQPSR